MASKKMVSKFNGTCRKCHKVILAGAEILWSREEGARHISCPTQEDFTFDLDGDTLRNRLAALTTYHTHLIEVMKDAVEELTGQEPEVCPRCCGVQRSSRRGITTYASPGLLFEEYNYSDTLDYSDWRPVQYTCGTALKMVYDSERRWPTFPGISETPNPECVAKWERWTRWNALHGHHSAEFLRAHPEVYGAATLINWTKNDLSVRSGDIATVINRGKEYTGKVTWVGEDSYSGTIRASVVLPDGTKKGGEKKTAKLVSRTVRAPREWSAR